MKSRRTFLKLMTAAAAFVSFGRIDTLKSRISQAMGDDALYIRAGQRVFLSGRYYRRVVVMSGGEIIGAHPGCTIGDLTVWAGAKVGYESSGHRHLTSGVVTGTISQLHIDYLPASLW